eukprot:3712867-Pyramimonas_sp.AAC.1
MGCSTSKGAAALKEEENENEQLANLHQAVVELRAAGRFAEAVPIARQQLERVEEMCAGKESPRVALALNSLASVYVSMGWYDDALPLFQRSIVINENLHHGKDHPDVA